MKWNILDKQTKSSTHDVSPEELVVLLLKNRGIVTKKSQKEFLSVASPDEITPKEVGIAVQQLSIAIKRIGEAIKNNEPVVVYGDYDADGICSTAIVWEALKDLGAKVLPFIPQREKEGYGLSIDGINSLIQDTKYQISRQSGTPSKAGQNTGLIITVDSGIVAHEAVEYAKKQGLDVIIIDHHEKPETLPKAHAIIHTTKLCAAGISYIFTNILNTQYKILDTRKWLELAAIATVTDLMPLLGANRSIVKYGLGLLNKTSRPGLRALFSIAGIEKVGTYEIGFMIGPRINASGRIENALTALRMLCTSDFSKALEYATLLNSTNKDRQMMTEEMTLHAFEGLGARGKELGKIIVVEHESYHQGVIGLVAGKLVEKYYLPAIVISRGETISKASARSITGFNIIEAIRSCGDLLVNAGGHPMAAGFTIETARIEEFRNKIGLVAEEKITAQLMEKELRVDCRLDLSAISYELYRELRQFEPFGLGNPEPTFASTVTIDNLRTVGQDGKHLKLSVISHSSSVTNDQWPMANDRFDAIAFGQGNLAGQIKPGDKINIAYTIDEDTYNGNHKLQLKIKDIVLQTK